MLLKSQHAICAKEAVQFRQCLRVTIAHCYDLYLQIFIPEGGPKFPLHPFRFTKTNAVILLLFRSNYIPPSPLRFDLPPAGSGGM
jgi:hypothetical protein